MESDQIKDILPLTELQKSMLYCIMADPETQSYFEQVRYTISGELDVKLLKKAWNVVVEYNDNLRTVFKWKGIHEPVQIILKRKEIPFDVVDISPLPDVEKEPFMDQLELIQWKKRVNLEKSPFRVTLYKRDELTYEMLLTTHHSIIDGWSNAIILTELVDVYHKLYQKVIPETKCKNTYRAYIAWRLKQKKEESMKFFRKYLSNMGEFTGMRTNKMRVNEPCREISYRLENSLIEQVNEFTKSNGITFAVLFYGIWALLTSKKGSQIDTTFGITISERPSEIQGIDEIAGLFIKTLPFRVKCQKQSTICDYLHQIQNCLLEWNQNSNVELSDLLYEGIIHNECIQSVVVIQNYPLSEVLKQQEGLKFMIDLHSSLYQMNLGLTVGVKMFGDFVSLDFSYLESVISEFKIKQYMDHIKILLESITSNNTMYQDISLNNIEELLERTMLEIKNEEETALEQIKRLRGDDFYEVF